MKGQRREAETVGVKPTEMERYWESSFSGMNGSQVLQTSAACPRSSDEGKASDTMADAGNCAFNEKQAAHRANAVNRIFQRDVSGAGQAIL